MKKIYWGLFFVVLAVNLQTFFKSLPAVDLLPDCIGYVLIYAGVREVRFDISRLERMMGLLLAAAVFSGCDWILCAMGKGGVLSSLLEILVLIMRLYIMHQIAVAYAEVPSIRERGERMQHCWKRYLYLMVIATLVALLLPVGIVAEGWGLVLVIGIVILVLSIAGFVYGIFYLVAAKRAAAEYVPDEVIGIEQENGEHPYDT